MNEWFVGRRLNRKLPKECIEECSAPGNNDNAVSKWRHKLQFGVPTSSMEYAKKYIISIGAWEENDVKNMSYGKINNIILWEAAFAAAHGNTTFYLGG